MQEIINLTQADYDRQHLRLEKHIAAIDESIKQKQSLRAFLVEDMRRLDSVFVNQDNE